MIVLDKHRKGADMLRHPRTADLFRMLLFLSIFAMALRTPIDTDMWWHLAAGRYSLVLRPLKFDLFSHTAEGLSWMNHSWLSQHFFYGLYKFGGLQAIALATASIVTLTFFILWPGRGNPYVEGFSLLLAALAFSPAWTPRPHLFSFLAFAIVLRCVEKLRGRREVLLLFLTFMLWANLHGGFVAGLLLLFLSFAGNLADSLFFRNPEAGRKARLLALILPLSILAVCFNPWGPELLLYPVRTLTIKTLQAYIQEWSSPDFHLLSNHPAIWLTAAVMLVMAFSGMPPRWADLLPLLAFFYLYLMSVRNVAFYSMVAGLFLARFGELALRRFGTMRISDRRSLLNTLILALAIVAVAIKGYWAVRDQTIKTAERTYLPAGAVEFILKEKLTGNLFNSYNWGGYLIWRLYPQCRVFVDGRTDLYGDEILGEFIKVFRAGERWEQILEKHNVKIVVVERTAPVVRCLQSQKGWRKVYEDSLAVVFVREGSLTQ